MNNMHLIACRTDFVEFLSVDDGVLGPGSEYDSQVEIFIAVPNGISHTHKRRDTGASRKSYNLLCISYGFVVQVTLRAGGNDGISLFPVVLDIRAYKPRVIALDGYVIYPFLGQSGRRTYGV